MTTWSTSTSSPNFASTSVRFTITLAPPIQPLLTPFVEAVYEACAWLDLEPPMSKDAVKIARRRLAQEHHPDIGGEAETMKQINAAADFLLALR